MSSALPDPIAGARDGVVVRFAGDSGDGMLLAGLRFAAAATHAGNDVHSMPLPPSEIRAPAGAITAVSAYQVHFGKHLFTTGDKVDALVAMNPASLKLHLADVARGGLLIVNVDSFEAHELERAGYPSNPLDDGSLSNFRVLKIELHRLNREAVAPVKLLSPREADRSRNFFALGLTCWLYQRPLEPTQRWVKEKFKKNPVMVDANQRALQAGYDYGKALGRQPERHDTSPAARPSGRYRRINGHEALTLGLVAAAYQMKKSIVYAGFPMVPASEMQRHLSDCRGCGITAVEAEDEMAAAGIALGAAFAGTLGVTVTTGPGLCLMSETLGLAVVSELPLVVIDVMRAGPGNGIPIASEQGDLLLATFGRNGDSPLVVLAPTSPADGFAISMLAVRLATAAMTPVVVLTDLHQGLASETWRVPALAELPAFEAACSSLSAFERNEKGVRPWVVPGTPGGEHRQSGQEKDDDTGRPNFGGPSHEALVARRIAKIDRLADEVPPAEFIGSQDADLLVIGWGSASGAVRAAVAECHARGRKVAGAIVASLHPLPRNLESIVKRHCRVLVAELNVGQMALILRARFAIDAATCSKVQGRPFEVEDLLRAIEKQLQAPR